MKSGHDTARIPAGAGPALLSFMLYAAADATAKLLTGTFDPIQIAFTRYSALFVGVLCLLCLRGPGLLRSHRPGLQIMRGVLASASVTSFILAIAKVPLSDAAALTFTAPFIVTVLAALLLGERVDKRHWIAIAICLTATLVIIRPGTGTMHPAAGFALISAITFALRQVASRILGGVDPIETTMAYTAIAATAILSLFLPFVWVTPPDGRSWGLLVFVAIAAGMGELCIVRALEIGEAVMIAPIQYTHIIWTTLFGWLLFGDLPDVWTVAGVVVIILTGLWTLSFNTSPRRATR